MCIARAAAAAAAVARPPQRPRVASKDSSSTVLEFTSLRFEFLPFFEFFLAERSTVFWYWFSSQILINFF